MQELLRLIDDRGDDVGMRMTGGIDGDAGGAVEKDVAVDVLDGAPTAARHDERIRARIRRRHDRGVAIDQRLARVGPGSGVFSCGASIR